MVQLDITRKSRREESDVSMIEWQGAGIGLTLYQGKDIKKSYDVSALLLQPTMERPYFLVSELALFQSIMHMEGMFPLGRNEDAPGN